MKLFKEWTSSVKSRQGRMVSHEALETLLKLRDPGYASVYSFTEADASEIISRGHSQGLKQYAVVSDYLVMDIDSGDEGLNEVTKILDERELGYDVWSSGGKGYHLYLPHDMIQSKDLPYSHRHLVKTMGLTEMVDETLYQHGRLLSLPGRVHPKTRKKKVFVTNKLGDELVVPIIKEPPPLFNVNIENDMDALTLGLYRLIDMITMPPTPGNRHTKLWGISKDLCEAGLSYVTVLELAMKVNETWKLQKPQDEVELAVQQAFKMSTK